MAVMSNIYFTNSWENNSPKTETKEVKKQNPYVPVRIDANESGGKNGCGVVVVHWNDGTETKVTCDTDDTFSVDTGFAQALKYKMFGGKTEYKEKWLRIIARRVILHGNTPKEIAKPLAKEFIKNSKKK